MSKCDAMRALFEVGSVPGKVPKVTGAPRGRSAPIPTAGPQSSPFNVRVEMRSGLYLRLPRVQGANTFAAFEEADPSAIAREATIRDSVSGVLAAMGGAYALGVAKLALVSLSTPAAYAWATNTSGVQSAIIANYKTLGRQIYNWATKLRADAERGFRLDDTGSPAGAYTWTRWADFGQELAAAIPYQSGAAWDASAVMVMFNTIRESANQMNPLKPDEWPTWAKVLVGLAAVGAGLYAVNTLTQAKRTFLPGAP